jgi:arginine-tRNA-protein transferase
MDGSPGSSASFSTSRASDTVEIVYRLRERIVAVGIADVEPLAMSAVYCYFAPGLESRSLGVFNVLSLVDHSRRLGLAHLYLGYYVAGSSAHELQGALPAL